MQLFKKLQNQKMSTTTTKETNTSNASNTPKMKTVVIQGYFRELNSYNQLIVNLDKAQATELIALTEQFEGKSPLQSWVSVADKSTKYSLKVSLSNRDAHVHKYFEKIAQKCGSLVNIGINIKPYDFVNDDGEQINGWKCVLTSIATATKSE